MLYVCGCRLEVTTKDAKLSDPISDPKRVKFGVQLFTAEENVFCNAENNSASAVAGSASMGVCMQVSCHGEGTNTKAFEDQYCTDPFVTYVKEQDDFGSFVDRCAHISGKVVQSCDSIEIHIQHKTQQFRMPTVINCKGAAVGDDSTPVEVNPESVKIWKYFKDTWPEFAILNADAARLKCKQQQVGVIFPQVKLVLRFGAVTGDATVPMGPTKMHQYVCTMMHCDECICMYMAYHLTPELFAHYVIIYLCLFFS